MKFLVQNYSCLQNPWLGGYRLQIPVLSVLCPQMNLLNPSPKQNSWIRHCSYAWADRKQIWNVKNAWCVLQVYPGYIYKVSHLPVLPIACKNSPVYFNALLRDLLYITPLIYNFTFVMTFYYTVNFRLLFVLKHQHEI